jgi:hypothetical protein
LKARSYVLDDYLVLEVRIHRDSLISEGRFAPTWRIDRDQGRTRVGKQDEPPKRVYHIVYRQPGKPVLDVLVCDLDVVLSEVDYYAQELNEQPCRSECFSVFLSIIPNPIERLPS